MMEPDVQQLLVEEEGLDIIRVVVLLLVGLPMLLVARRWIRKVVTRNYSAHYGLLTGRLVFYTGMILLLITVLHQLGFNLTALLGAAGILGVAVGFASQTSVSNIISGFFLIAEQPFEIGDVITVGGNTGAVLSIDMLSVKLRLFNNNFVRVPNELLLKSEVINLTRFPIRRVDCKVSVAYKEDLERVRSVLFDVARNNTTALMQPEPLVIFDGFGDSSINLLFLVWAEKSEFMKLRNSIQMDVKKRFDQEGIEIPFPHVSVYTGSQTTPYPVQIAPDKPDTSRA